jgi:hypothetical protein
MRQSAPLRALALFLLVSGCSSDSGDGNESVDSRPYGNVVEWRCFEGPLDCWCPGLTRGNDASSSEPRVDACSYTNCYTYEDGGWHCECRPDPFEPEQHWENPKAVQACPPE